MATATIRSCGEVIDYTPVSAVAAGDVVVLSSVLIGVAEVAIAANSKGALRVRGCAKFPKTAGAGALNQGVKVYWDATNSVMTTTNSFVAAGNVAADAANSATTVEVVFYPGA